MRITKRVFAAVMAASVAAVSLGSMFSASAARKYSTYHYYFDVPANTYATTCNANVSYNPNNTVYAGSANGNLGGTFAVNDIAITDTSSITYVNYTNSEPTSSAGVLGRLTFKTTTTAPSVTVTLVKNDRGNNLVTSTVTAVPVLAGDVNLDGTVNDTDVTYLNKYLAGALSFSTEQWRAADVDADGEVGTIDSGRLVQYLNGNMESVIG